MQIRSQIDSPDPESTRQIGHQLGQRLRAGDLVTLSGGLGAGKTTFVQGVAAALGAREAVNSPTFVLIVEHEGATPFLHLDAYRLEDADDETLRDAGIFEFLDRSDAVKLVEWPQYIEEYLPAPRFAISIEQGTEENMRHIETIEYSL